VFLDFIKVLYKSFDCLSRIIFLFGGKITATNSGGPRAGSSCQELFSQICQNFRKSAVIIPHPPRFCQVKSDQTRQIYFRQNLKKDLTNSPGHCIIGAGQILRWFTTWWWAQTGSNYLHQSLKKDLTSWSGLHYNGRGAFSLNYYLGVGASIPD